MILDAKFQYLQGQMSADKLQQFKSLLSSPDFRGMSGDHGGLLRQKAEAFAAEVVQPDMAGPFARRGCTGLIQTAEIHFHSRFPMLSLG
jgi:hypothetical protein